MNPRTNGSWEVFPSRWPLCLSLSFRIDLRRRQRMGTSHVFTWLSHRTQRTFQKLCVLFWRGKSTVFWQNFSLFLAIAVVCGRCRPRPHFLLWSFTQPFNVSTAEKFVGGISWLYVAHIRSRRKRKPCQNDRRQWPASQTLTFRARPRPLFPV